MNTNNRMINTVNPHPHESANRRPATGPGGETRPAHGRGFRGGGKRKRTLGARGRGVGPGEVRGGGDGEDGGEGGQGLQGDGSNGTELGGAGGSVSGWRRGWLATPNKIIS